MGGGGNFFLNSNFMSFLYFFPIGAILKLKFHEFSIFLPRRSDFKIFLHTSENSF